MPEAITVLQSNDKVLVSTDKWFVFQPKTSLKHVGFVFYPGGRVNPRSYARAEHAIAEKGYLTVIVPMPLNQVCLDWFNSNKSSKTLFFSELHSVE